MDARLPSEEEFRQGIELGRRLYGYWKQLGKALGGGRREVMLTGMQGVGKSVLFDYMTGKAYQAGYKPPDTSTSSEQGKLNKSVGLLVIPGQASTPRYEAAEATILGKRPPVGIIHVVANGFASIRGDGAASSLRKTVKLKTIASLRSELLLQEASELVQVCEWIRQAHRKGRRPAWLMLAVTKYDLFPTDMSIGKKYFPSGDGPIAKQLDRLTSQVGSDNFRWQAANVCGWLEDYEWKDAAVPSVYSVHQRDTLVEELVKKILGLCE